MGKEKRKDEKERNEERRKEKIGKRKSEHKLRIIGWSRWEYIVGFARNFKVDFLNDGVSNW